MVLAGVQHCSVTVVYRYDDVLSPQDIYSLVGLTAFYNGFFGQCSQAFTRLESLHSLPEVGSITWNLPTCPVVEHHENE